MRLRKGMMLDFIKLGQGLVVNINKKFESTVGMHPYAYEQAHTEDRVILTNKYDVAVLVEGTLYPLHIVMHYEWQGDLCRIEWKELRNSPWAPSGLAELLWES